MNRMNWDLKVQALIEFLKTDGGYPEVTVDDIKQGQWYPNFEVFGKEYDVFDETDRDPAVKEYIKENLWTFTASYLASKTDLPQEMFAILVEKCESGNSAILKIVEGTCGLDKFVKAAVSDVGYGNMLSSYDGNEYEINLEGMYYFIYRQS